MSELPRISDYSPDELKRAESWPAIQRYLPLLSLSTIDQKDKLRQTRHEAWLRCALATFHDRATAREICAYWSRASQSLIHDAWLASSLSQHQYCLLALGKLGAEELNLSSDVDLILVRKDDAPIDLKALREFQTSLSELTAFGYALRVDFTLRPGGKPSSAIPSSSEFEYHYGYHGEMWERLAYVRMRVIEGPDDLTNEIKTFSRKFSFRKHLDYTLLEDLKSLRSKIRAEKFETRPNFFHLKLGIGGIRELELFVHALLVIHGGRNTALQTHSTTLALERIRDSGLLPSEECEFLIEAYWYLRDLENRLQGFEDQQDYSLDLSTEHPALPKGFPVRLKSVCARVTQITSSLFGEDQTSDDFPEDIEGQTKWLVEHGFAKHSVEDTWPALLAATALSRRTEADEKARLTFLRGFIEKLSESKLDRDLGLSLLLDFVRGVRAKASFFTLLNREPKVRDQLALLFSISPYLGSLLASRPELIDEFIYRKQAPLSSDFNLVLEELAERRLLAELISANHFLSDRDLTRLSVNLSSNADTICIELLNRIKNEVSGENASDNLSLLALGKWGGRELGLRSDLDFIFITREAATADDHKIAKRFLSRITEPHRGGAIYSVDMRLRPSGHSGPIMVSADELDVYLRDKSAAWERQAYLRARPLTDLAIHPAKVAAAKRLSESDINELTMIRSKLFNQLRPGELDLKLVSGGLADVEFTAQISLLALGEFSIDPSTSGMIQYLEGIDSKWSTIGQEVRGEYGTLRLIEQLFQLTTSQSGSKLRVKSDEFNRLAMILGLTAPELEEKIRGVFQRLDSLLKSVRVVV